MGIRDRRVICIIAQMLRAGIMKETAVNELGVPQGGLISPLLANVHLHSLDQWITREWEAKRTRRQYSGQGKKIRALRNRSKLKPAYFIRYAEDWVLITDSWENAYKWKQRIAKYLQTNLKIKLSDDKTKITNTVRTGGKASPNARLPYSLGEDGAYLSGIIIMILGVLSAGIFLF